MDMNEDQKSEKIGRAIVNLTWLWFAIKFVVIVSVIPGIVLYLINKPLWIAPLIGIGAFIQTYLESSTAYRADGYENHKSGPNQDPRPLVARVNATPIL